MAKRILSMVLCVVLLAGTLAGCKTKTVAKETGGYITMYLTDEIYDFDPANAYYNSNLSNVLSLMFATLFRLTDSGKVENYLVDSYKIYENKEADEYYMEFKLKETYWSVQDALTAEDVVFAWKRLVNAQNNYEAAALLYDIKNARAVKEGDVSIDDLGVEAVEQSTVRVTFEGPTDYDRFIRNLTSVATAPLLRRYVAANPNDWAKKASSIATSGPFKLSRINYQNVTTVNDKGREVNVEVEDDYAFNKDGTLSGTTSKWPVKKLQYFVLERNSYFDRDLKRDQVNATVTPYRLLVDCTKTAEELLEDYNNGHLFYIGSIPLSLRNNETVQQQVEVSDALSTFVCYLNENALIGGEYLFAKKEVRQALSMALDRDAIAKTVVYAKAADGLVPYGVFEKDNSGEFRTSKNVQVKLMTTAQVDEAKALLSSAGVTPGNYSFTIKVASYSEVHKTIVNAVAEAWNNLGFKVTVEEVQPIQNNDMLKEDDKEPTKDICDDRIVEAFHRGTFEVIAMDAGAMTADAYSMLANYAYAFSGGIYADSDNGVYESETHITGYDSVEYNILMEAIYYLPYFADIENRASDSFLRTNLDTKPYAAMASAVEHKLTAAATASNKAIENSLKTIETLNQATTKDAKSLIEAYTGILATILQQMNATGPTLLPLSKDLAAAKASEAAETAAKTALETVLKNVNAAIDAAKTASGTKVTVDSTAAEQDAFYAACEAAITAYKTAVASEQSAAEAAKAVADAADQITLRDAIQKVYDDNGINPNTKISKQGALRATLLHKAEEMLLTDLPVIPIIYNQNATLTSKQLSKVGSTYYCVSDFQKAKLKNADSYVDENGDSIFKNFPEILWDSKVG